MISHVVHEFSEKPAKHDEKYSDQMPQFLLAVMHGYDRHPAQFPCPFSPGTISELLCVRKKILHREREAYMSPTLRSEGISPQETDQMGR